MCTRTQPLQSDAAFKQLLLSAPDANALAAKFAELKAHKVQDLDKVVVLLAKLLTGAYAQPLYRPSPPRVAACVA
jgi:hypothetical protein